MDIPQNWTFETPEIVANFDAHVRTSLPWYDLALGAVAFIVRAFLPDKGTVIDVGCSTGNLLKEVGETLEARNAKYVGIDSSYQMVRTAIENASEYEFTRHHVSLAEDFDFVANDPDVIVCFLTLMFVPPSRRDPLILRMIKSLKKGGALIVFDKRSDLPSGELAAVLYRLTLAAKYEAGAKPEEIIAKELSLSGVQRPVDGEELLIRGFSQVFQFGVFAGWVYVRP